MIHLCVCVWETIGHSISLQLLLRIENVQSYQDSPTFLYSSLSLSFYIYIYIYIYISLSRSDNGIPLIL